MSSGAVSADGEAACPEIRAYRDEHDLPEIIAMIAADLSEPYSIYVYRYFIHQWPNLCFIVSLCFHESIVDCVLTMQAYVDGEPIGTIVCKLEDHRGLNRGYIAMLAVKKHLRGRGIATQLVEKAIYGMIKDGADEVCLETEVSNPGAMKLYENLGFLRFVKRPSGMSMQLREVEQRGCFATTSTRMTRSGISCPSGEPSRDVGHSIGPDLRHHGVMRELLVDKCRCVHHAELSSSF